MIAKMDRVDSHPTNLNRLNSIFGPLLSHPKYGWLVVVGIDNKITAFLTTMLAKMFRFRYQSVNTVDQAMDFLRSVDSTLAKASNE